MRRHALTAVVMALALWPLIDAGAQSAGASDHFVQVTVVGGVIRVDPDTLPVRGKNATIFWVLQTAGCTFPDDAVAFKTSTDDQFSDGQSQANGRRYHLKNKNTVLKDYPYMIKVMQGSTLLQLDPTIRNNG